jgi:hypothetical protein
MNLNTISMPWQASPTNLAILYIPKTLEQWEHQANRPSDNWKLMVI